MEAQFRGKAHAYGPVVTDSKAAGKRSLEWDLNDWKWDGDLLVASSLNPVSGDCRSSQFLPVMTETPLNNAVFHSSSLYGGGTNIAQENGKNELEKRIVIMAEDEAHEEAVALNLKLGGKSYPLVDDEVDKWEGGSGKKTKVAGNANIPSCQVENCGADLTNAKDYHRRHKVCEMHSKATQALVGNVTQRFCQQCSRFHALQEFDEGKRSCRRRLAGHNRRRRKTHPETAVNAESLHGEKLSSYLLISLLRVLSNLHSNESNQSKDQDLLSQLLRNLQGETNGTSIPGLAQRPQAQGVPNIGTSTVPHEKDPSRDEQHFAVPSNEAQKGLSTHNPPGGMLQNPSEVQGRVPATCDMVPARQNVQETLKRYNIDLNNVCIDSQDCLDDQELAHASVGVPFRAQKDSLKSSPPQTSRNSGSTSTQSPSSSSGSDSQSRTDRIIFKLFGKDPGDLPHLLRNQLLQWLSQSPTDIEGYIRPGCIVLTIYLRLNKTSWEELCCQLSSKLSRLLDMPNDNFWRTGWIYTRVQHSMAFVCDGRVVLETPLTLRSYKNCQIASISPIAVPASKTVQFVVRGYNVSQSMSRLLCALNGNYLVEESCSDLLEDADTLVENNDIQCLSFSCSIPNIAGRGFIEVEDSGMRGSFFPFIVADADVCSEICTLERIIESAETCEDLLQGQEAAKMEPKAKALEFIHEMGWLLHRSSSNIRLHHVEGFGECFSFERFKWLLDFSMDHAWPAVLKKLLDLLFIGVVDSGAYPSAENALQEMGLLHHAVRKNSRCLVECLLAYVPENSSRRLEYKEKQTQYGQVGSFFYRPDAMGPGGLTPLHLAASSSGFEDVLDALLEDPGMMGIEAWKTARDSTGLTPSDYASLRGHYSYINLVQQKTQRKPIEGQVAVDIPDSRAQTKHSHNLKSAEVHSSFHTEKLKTLRSRDWQCNVCERKLRYGRAGMAFAYRPAMLSMVAVAAVCVCVALLFKTLPVVYVCQPFRWEALKYGAM